MAPPSKIAGHEYSVAKKQASSDTFDWAAAKQLLRPEPERQPYKPPGRDAAKPRDLSHLPNWLAARPEGSRNESLYWASCRAAEAGDTATLESLGNAARASGLDPGEVGRTIRSAQATVQRGAGQPGIEHTEPQPEAGALTIPQEQQGGPALPTRWQSGP